MDLFTSIVPVNYVLTRDRFVILQPMTLTYIPSIPEEAGAFRISFAPPGCNDVQVIEGKLERIKSSVVGHDGEHVDVWCYLVQQQVFLMAPEPVDKWIESQFIEHGAINDFEEVGATPCWLSLKSFWQRRMSLMESPIELELVNFFGAMRLRHAYHGRTIDIQDIIKH